MTKQVLSRLAENWFLVLGAVLLSCLLKLQVANKFPDPQLEKALDATVMIMDGKGGGTGFFITPDGCAMTAFHVISDGLENKRKIRLNVRGHREWLDADVVAGNEFLDTAVLCVDYKPPYWFRISNSESVQEGDKVYVMGHPMGRRWNLTDGIISRMNYKNEQVGKFWIPRFAIFTTAFISWGNSGGPLINARGDVIGMVVQWDNPGIGHPNSMNIAVSGTDLVRFIRTIWGRS